MPGYGGMPVKAADSGCRIGKFMLTNFRSE